MAKSGIDKTEQPGSRESELKVRPSGAVAKQLQAKFRIKEFSPADIDDLTTKLKAALKLGDFEFGSETRLLVQDEYLDDEDLTFYKSHISFRARRIGGQLELTLKSPAGHLLSGLNRNEITKQVSEADYRQLGIDGFRQYLAEQLGELKKAAVRPVLINNNDRISIVIKRKTEEYELSLDSFTHTDVETDQSSGQYFEIEIEAKNDSAVKHLPGIGMNLSGALDLEVSTESKYEQGVSRLELIRNGHKQGRLSLLSRRLPQQGMAFWSPVLGGLGVIATIVGIVITL